MLLMNRCLGTVARMGGVPTLFEDFHDSVVDLALWNAQYLCSLGEYVHYPRPPRVSIHDVARNMIVETMRGDWVLMLDSDHSFEPDLVARLMLVSEQCEADVVVGMYQFKFAPYVPVVYMLRGEAIVPLADWDERITALDVAAAGAGCLWVKRSVFDRIEAELKEKPFDRISGQGEDISFFARLRKLNIKAVCNPQVECNHLEVRPVSLKHYDRQSVEIADPEMAKGYR